MNGLAATSSGLTVSRTVADALYMTCGLTVSVWIVFDRNNLVCFMFYVYQQPEVT